MTNTGDTPLSVVRTFGEYQVTRFYKRASVYSLMSLYQNSAGEWIPFKSASGPSVFIGTPIKTRWGEDHDWNEVG